ncbi:heterokaryon incompatibility protein-domain-containing protein [Xylariaceae sp. FL0255]|nr:heterokaryon incompatibility protein-domain-containing protein [Xylariaceae sp. FL0255]
MTEIDSLPLYQYRPLETEDSIRILKLEPAGSESQPLRGSIFHTRRQYGVDPPQAPHPYCAVSYTWGDAEFSQRLILEDPDNPDGHTYLPISSNVKIMLQHFRSDQKPRYYWIDALSLDQQNEKEKAQQIPLMGDIYHQAEKVRIWLGLTNQESHEDVSSVFAFLRMIAFTPETMRDSEGSTAHSLNENMIIPYVRDLFNRDWFFRRWVLQEAKLARRAIFHCGRHTIPYPLVIAACRVLQHYDRTYGSIGYGVQVVLALSELDRNTTNFLSLLIQFRQSHCQDEKDRFAALLGLVPPHVRPSIDYTDSYQQIYTKQAIELVNSASSHALFLHLFTFGPLQGAGEPHVASWIPNWASEQQGPYSIPLVGTEDKFAEPIALHAYRKWLQKGESPQMQVRSPQAEPRPWSEWTKTLTYDKDVFCPCAFPSVTTDESGRPILSISWLNAWGDWYGWDISKVVSATMLNLKDIVFSNGRQLEALAILIEHLMTTNDSRSLYDFEDERHRLMIVKSALYLAFDSGESVTNERIAISVLAELTHMLQESHLSIARLDDLAHDTPVFIIGPSNMEVGMKVIPLASTTEPYSRGGRSRDLEIMWEMRPDKRGKRFRGANNVVFSNMLVVKPLPRELEVLQPLVLPSDLYKNALGKNAPENSVNGLPIRATYVGPCLCSTFDADPRPYQILPRIPRGSWKQMPPLCTIDIV